MRQILLAALDDAQAQFRKKAVGAAAQLWGSRVPSEVAAPLWGALLQARCNLPSISP